MRKGAKRKARHKGESPKKPPAEEQKNEPSESPSHPAEEQKNEASQSPRHPAEENHLQEKSGDAEPEPSKEAAAKGRRKRAKVSKPETEPEYFPEKRNLWDQLDMVYQYKWNFSNLEDAFEEGGELHNKKVYLFGCTEPQLVSFQGQGKVTMIPVVVAVVSPFPPSDKIGIKSVQRETEEIVPMKQMKMDWVPYIPLEKRAGLKHLKIDRVKKFEYCLPCINKQIGPFLSVYVVYKSHQISRGGRNSWRLENHNFYHPFQEDEIEQSTIVELLFPIDPKPVFCEFDWELDELEEFTDKLIEEEELPADQKEPFKDFVKEKVREAKKANREARETRKRTLAEMSEETRAAFENMRFYKFYPVPSPDTPDVSSVKCLLPVKTVVHTQKVTKLITLPFCFAHATM
ncbi:UNVERIFIED_CONTAM: protein HEAT INTOLERANT 4 [Sesamum angustifolium]|uniref:Protein HEAT INTOLERANT 4 n=1 Tax=Sesamum angustifolium TaxID=2727405 RepID=A0AAW2IRA0_9LAMI